MQNVIIVLINCVDERVKNNGIVLFSTMDSEILNEKVITGGYNTMCWRCEKPYQLVGLEHNFNFVAGICHCEYQK